MKTFKKYLEGKDDYNPPGSPHYAHSEFKPDKGQTIEPTPYSKHADETAGLHGSIKALKEKVGSKFRFLPINYNHKEFGDREGTLTLVGKQNVSFIMDGETKKRVLPMTSFYVKPWYWGFEDGKRVRKPARPRIEYLEPVPTTVSAPVEPSWPEPTIPPKSPLFWHGEWRSL